MIIYNNKNNKNNKISIISPFLDKNLVKEKYINVPLYIYNVKENPEKIDIIIDYFDNSETIKNKLTDIKGVNLLITKKDASNTQLKLTDTFTYLYNFPNFKVLTVVNDSKYCLFIKPKDNIINEPIKNVITSGKIIGYINDLDTILIKYICISINIDINLLKLIKVSLPTVINDDYFKNNDIYSLMIFTSLTNTVLLKTIDNQFKMDFLNYEDFEINKVKFLIPFVKIMNIDLSVRFINFKNDYAIKTCFAFDFLLCGYEQIENNKDLGFKLNKLIVRFDSFKEINYYTMFFNFFKQTINYLDKSNNYIQIRDNLPILEQFIVENQDKSRKITFDIIPKNNIDGFYNYEDQSMILNYIFLNEIPLTLHSRITLNEQDRIEENGNYFVKYRSNGNREDLLNGSKTIIQKYLIYDGPIDNIIDDMININNIIQIDGIYIKDIRALDNIKIIKINKMSNLITIKNDNYLKIKKELNILKENSTYDNRYECYNDQLIKSRGLCESNYDALGKPKLKKQYWDRRCQNNSDCPFYMANKNYKNYHGSCLDGYCELPLGMKNISYRKYDPDLKPMCYNCKDNTDPFCCEDQKDKKKYPGLKSPDYAFPLDIHERMNQLKDKTILKWFYH
jgi:hypothetical protein